MPGGGHPHDEELAMTTKRLLTGNGAAALAVKLCQPKVICAYPITPQTPIVEYLAKFVADGELKAEYIPIEGEHSAMAACIAASLAGARTYTATSSQGLAYMQEGLFYAAGVRAPILMTVVNRSLAAPWTILAGEDDSISQRDTGWIQFYCESVQEVLDTHIQAYRVAEDWEVRLPVMVCLDGFNLSHCYEYVEVPRQRDVDEFLPPFRPMYRLDVEDPKLIPPFEPPEWFMAFKLQQEEAMENAKRRIREVDEQFSERFGRGYGLVEPFLCEDADAVIVAMGTIAGTAREAVARMRRKRRKVGLVRIRVFRPFPREELKHALRGVKAVGVIDRNYSFGCGGAVFTELRSALYGDRAAPIVLGFVAGLGGQDVTVHHVMEMAEKVLGAAETGEVERETEWIGIRRRKPCQSLNSP